MGVFTALAYVHRLLPLLANGLRMETAGCLLGTKGSNLPDLRLLILNGLQL